MYTALTKIHTRNATFEAGQSVTGLPRDEIEYLIQNGCASKVEDISGKSNGKHSAKKGKADGV